MSPTRCHTLGEVAAHIDDLLHDYGPDMPVGVDHEGVMLDTIEVRVADGRVVVY